MNRRDFLSRTGIAAAAGMGLSTFPTGWASAADGRKKAPVLHQERRLPALGHQPARTAKPPTPRAHPEGAGRRARLRGRRPKDGPSSTPTRSASGTPSPSTPPAT